MTNRSLILYVCLVKAVACLLFFLGFFSFTPPDNGFSSKHNLPTVLNGTKLRTEKLYYRHYNRAIFILIDAFRLDFLLRDVRMPFLQQHLHLNTSCLLHTQVESPTVTLPRIKAILSGVAPGYLDVLHNLGSNEMTGDNIINQAILDGYRIVFYGDDTWLKLFPKSFVRHEGVSSFDVNDFYEVDLSVTRNAKKELAQLDWDLMILHYLGLDHIGHVEGPYGYSVSAKLLEMDAIIEYIHKFSEKLLNDHNMDTLIVITADHGMKNSGGHGGSSFEEITVPFIILNYNNCKTFLPARDRPFQQVDITTFLSVLLGLPIPAGSRGKASHHWIHGLKAEESLYITFYTTQFMKNHFHLHDDDVEDHFNKGVEFYYAWLNSSQTPVYKSLAIEHFLAAQDVMAEKMTKRNEVNLVNLAGAISLCFMAMGLLLADHYPSVNVFLLFSSRTNSCLMLLAFSCLLLVLPDDLLSIENAEISLMTVLFLNSLSMLLRLSFSPKKLFRMNFLNKAFLLVFALLPISYLSTSFIEEEHHYWNFTFVTMLFLLVYDDLGQWRRIMLALLLQLLMKNINHTGDKWADIPDIGDWLKLPENQTFLSFVYSICYTIGLEMIWKHNIQRVLCSKESYSVDMFLFLAQAICITLFRIAKGEIWTSLFYLQSRSVIPVWAFWIFTALRLIHSMFLMTKMERRHVSRAVISSITQLHYSIVSLLVKPHNAILGPSLIFVSDVLTFINGPWLLGACHYWIGMNYFFFMGNSNSIASLDVTVGFVGLTNFNIVLATIYCVLHTFAFPILSYLLLCEKLLNKKFNVKKAQDVGKKKPEDGRNLIILNAYLLLNGIPLVVYMVAMVFQREHLFIWSVFSPKLFYLMVQSLIIISFAIPSCFLL